VTQTDPLPPTAATDGDWFRDLERRRLRSLVDADLVVATELHAADYQLITPGGRALSRDDYLGGIASGALHYRVFEPASDVVVLWLGDGVALRYVARIEIDVEGEPDEGFFWHTDLYRRRDGRWQAVWSHATETTRRPGSG